MINRKIVSPRASNKQQSPNDTLILFYWDVYHTYNGKKYKIRNTCLLSLIDLRSFPILVYEFVISSRTKFHKLGDLTRHLLSWPLSKIKALVGFIHPKNYEEKIHSRHLHLTYRWLSSTCVLSKYSLPSCLCVQFFFFCKHTSLVNNSHIFCFT